MEDGDVIYAVAGKPVERLGSVGSEMIMNEAKTVTVIRHGDTINLNVPPGVIGQLNKNRLMGLTLVRYPLVVDSLLPKARVSGDLIRHNDTLINLDGHPVYYISDLLKDSTFDHLKEKKSVALAFRRGNDTIHSVIDIDPKIGLPIHLKTMEDLLGSVHTSYTFWQAIPAGVHKSVETLTNYIRNLKLLFTSKEVKAQDSLGSVISIASVFPSVWDWQAFWTLTGIFSILLAFMNVLPIPALDGGHALFTLVEMISGRKPSDKFIEYAQMVGMVLLFGIMIYALGLDIFHSFKFK
jgi:regulator of sigma E protease